MGRNSHPPRSSIYPGDKQINQHGRILNAVQQSASKSWTVLTGPMPMVPCHPTLAHFWKGEGTQNRTKLPHMKRKHATRPAIQRDVSRVLPGRLQSRTKHLTGQVYALSPHIPVRLAAQGRWLGLGIRSLLVARETIAVHASSLITPSYCPTPPALLIDFFSLTLGNDVSYPKGTTVHSKVCKCGFTK